MLVTSLGRHRIGALHTIAAPFLHCVLALVAVSLIAQLKAQLYVRVFYFKIQTICNILFNSLI